MVANGLDRTSVPLWGSKTRQIGYRPEKGDDDYFYDALEIEAGKRENTPISWYPGHIAKAERQLAEQQVKDAVEHGPHGPMGP